MIIAKQNINVNLGRLIRESDSSEQNVTEYKYYDDSDLIASSISTVGFESEPYTTTNTYTYDSNGRLTEQISETTNSWGSSTIQLRYTYDYAPFAFVESYFEGAWHPYQLEIQKDIPSSLGTYWIDDNTQFEMRDGLLSKAISEHSTCEFFYD